MEPSKTKSTRKILVVDDITFNRTVLEKILTKSGYLFASASSGEQALQMVEMHVPDLILLDFMMPGMNGLEVIKFLKEDPRFKAIPVMFLTASDEIENMTDAFNAGAADYITKPFKPAELNARVSTQIRRLDDAEALFQKMQEQQELVHVLAHDLRNPLVACRGLVELLESGDAAVPVVGPRIRESMQKCLDTIELVRKKGLLDNDVTRLQIEPLDLYRQVISVVSDFEEPLFQKGIVVENEVPQGLMILADRPSLINIVISNVLSNAIKFSYPNCKIKLSAIVNGETISLMVKDHGMGIPEYLLPMIFDPKKVSRRAGTLNEQGTGYGMGLVKKVMQAYQGKVLIESVAKSADNRRHGTTVELVFARPKSSPSEV